MTETSEQEEFLKECEEEFKTRYSEEDEAFMKIKSITESKPPPIMDPWYNKSRKPPPHSNNPSYHNRHNQGQSNLHYRNYSRPYDRPSDRYFHRQERQPYYRRR